MLWFLDLDPHHVCRNVMLLRAVIREDMSMSMVDELIKDLHRAIEWLDHHYTFSDAEVKTLSTNINEALPSGYE